MHSTNANRTASECSITAIEISSRDIHHMCKAYALFLA
jgi:hypothetical protein